MHDPEIVFLDEPTIGLDIMVKEKIREFIRTVNRDKQTTVILTTHDMQDIKEICSRVIIIDQGSTMYDGGMNEIKNQFGKEREVLFKVRDLRADELREHLGECGQLLLLSLSEHEVHVRFDRQSIHRLAL